MQAAERRRLVRDQARTPAGVWITCAAPSMEPTVRVGQRVCVRASGAPRIGEVVAFETHAGDAYVLHRVLLTIPLVPWFVHGGDAHPDNEPGVAHRRQVIGIADLPRRRPPARQYVRAIRRAARAALRTFVGARRDSRETNVGPLTAR